MQKSYDRMKENLLGELKKTFRPEFLNRIDGVVVFHPLERNEIRQIVDLMLVSVTKQMAEKGINLEVEASAKDYLGAKGYDEVFGAGPSAALFRISLRINSPRVYSMVTLKLATRLKSSCRKAPKNSRSRWKPPIKKKPWPAIRANKLLG